MTREEIVSHNDDVRKFISDLKYKLSFIDEKKVIVCKKQLKSIRTPIQVPFDVVTYENIMMNRIKTISRTVMKEHKDMEIKKEPKEVPVSDVVGWLEIMIHNKKKFLTPSFYINYKKYNRYKRKDNEGNVKKNFYKIYSLQKEMVRSEMEYIITVYRMLPKMLQMVREEKND